MREQSNGKVRRSESEWREIMNRFQCSAKNQDLFCREEGLSRTSFQRWSKRLEPVSGVGDPRFVEIAPAVSSSGIQVELYLPGGMVLRIGG